MARYVKVGDLVGTVGTGALNPLEAPADKGWWFKGEVGTEGILVVTEVVTLGGFMHFSGKQKNFMVAGGQTVTEWNLDPALRYVDHIKEEAKELHDAVADSDWVKAVDAAADLKVVANGFLFSLGIEPWEVDLFVYLANQRKIVDGKVYRRPDGQIGKPPGWVGPEDDIAEIVREVQK